MNLRNRGKLYGLCRKYVKCADAREELYFLDDSDGEYFELLEELNGVMESTLSDLEMDMLELLMDSD